MRRSASTDNIAADEAAFTERTVAQKKSRRTAPVQSERIKKLLSFDMQMRQKWLRDGGAFIVGTDEVGRGCLAGPVLAAAVIMPDMELDSELASLLSSLNDSKKLSPARRVELVSVLKEHCRFAIAEASVEEIERINILQASFLAMRRALEQLAPPSGSLLLVDGNSRVSGLEMRQILVVGGDGISASIAAASVLAKVERDALMERLHEKYPQYRFDANKGYGSKDHREAILQHGLTEFHRRSFCSKTLNEQLKLN